MSRDVRMDQSQIDRLFTELENASESEGEHYYLSEVEPYLEQWEKDMASVVELHQNIFQIKTRTKNPIIWSPENVEKMVNDMYLYYGNKYKKDKIHRLFYYTWEKWADYERLIKEWLRIFRNEHNGEHNGEKNVRPEKKRITDVEVDDLMDGIATNEEIIEHLFIKHFPYLTYMQVLSRVKGHEGVYQEMREKEIKKMKHERSGDYKKLKRWAKLCIEYYGFDMENHKEDMQEDLYDFVNPLQIPLLSRVVIIRKGLCCKMLEKCFKITGEELMAESEERESIPFEDRVGGVINDDEIDDTIDEALDRNPTVLKLSVVERMVTKDLFFKKALVYSFKEITERVTHYFIQNQAAILLKPEIEAD